jgi:hypothetical protein
VHVPTITAEEDYDSEAGAWRAPSPSGAGLGPWVGAQPVTIVAPRRGAPPQWQEALAAGPSYVREHISRKNVGVRKFSAKSRATTAAVTPPPPALSSVCSFLLDGSLLSLRSAGAAQRPKKIRYQMLQLQ